MDGWRVLHEPAVVRGGVQKLGDRVRISANLVHAPTNRTLWEHIYDTDLRDVLDLQAQISDVVSAIKAKLTPEQEARLAARHKVNPEAYEAYLRGRYGGGLSLKESHS